MNFLSSHEDNNVVTSKVNQQIYLSVSAYYPNSLINSCHLHHVLNGEMIYPNK